MTTSASTNYEADRNAIIKGALRIVGAIGQGDTPTSDQYTESAEALNQMVKAFMADGMPVWAITTTSFALVDGTSRYRIGTGQTVNTSKPLKVIQAYIRNTTSNVDTPMRIITRDDYYRLGNKSTEGLPIQLFYHPQNLYGDLYLFPTPDSSAATTYQIHIVYQRIYEDFDAATDTPDFPQEWHEALKYGLAARLAPEYGMPPNDRKILVQEAQMARMEALSSGTEEGSLFFSAELRNW